MARAIQVAEEQVLLPTWERSRNGLQELGSKAAGNQIVERQAAYYTICGGRLASRNAGQLGRDLRHRSQKVVISFGGRCNLRLFAW